MNTVYSMVSDEKFEKIIGYRFWRHIHKETLIPFKGTAPTRQRFLRDLAKKIRKMKYVPSPPRAFVVSHKQNLVVRFIPTMTREDYCVYFFCVKSLEDEIALNRVKGTYGGWRLGGKIRRVENFDDAPSMPDNSYSKFEWMREWKEYQKRAFNLYRNKKFEYFIVFDIANFYDSVRLSRLELLLRESTQKTKTPIVNLLMYFLFNWGRRDFNYQRQSAGLPQDEVGDCSRILANFYLQDYDMQMRTLTLNREAGYLRFADDQIIAAKDEKTAKEIMFIASKELAKIGLNLNASKAKFFENRDDFKIYWSFDIFKLLSNKNDRSAIEEAFRLLKARMGNTDFREDTILKRLLSCNLYRASSSTRDEILSLANKRDFLTGVNDYYLNRIYGFTPKEKRSAFLKQLNKYAEEVLYNQFHLRVMKFAREAGVTKRDLNKLQTNLRRLDDLGG